MVSATLIDGVTIATQEYSPWVLLGFGFLLLMTGRLISKGVHEERIADIKEDRNHWRTTAEKNANTITTLTETNNKLTESTEFQTHVMESLKKASEESSNDETI